VFLKKKLKISEENYRNVVDNSSELILVIQDGFYKFFNPKVEKYLKYTSKELMGKPFIDFIHPEDKKLVAARYAKRMRGDKNLPDNYFFRIVDKAGMAKWVEISTVLITWEGRPATLNFLQDVTIRKKAETELELRVEELEKTKTAMLKALEDMQKEKKISELQAHDMEKFKLAVEGVSEHIIITDTDANIIFANHAAEMATGFTVSEMVGKNPGTLWGGQMKKDFFDEMWNTIKKEKKPYSGELTNKTKSGELYTAALHIAPILNKKGKVEFFVAIERDITKAKEVDKMKTEFISVASHQLRTPLTTVKWYSELLLSTQNDLNKKTADYVHKIYDSNQKMISLVNDLLNVSRIESGKKFMIEKKTADIVSVIRRAVADQSILAGQNNIKIDADGLPKKLILNIDSEKIYQVFQNLLVNAVKYSRSGGKVEVGCKQGGDGLILTVRDRGLGIPASQQDRVFEKFFRADNVVESGKGGSGLGLYIARAIVEGHNGRLWFESSVKGGTTFYVQLPIPK
jgi:PAS domain S-box-containing protein